MTITQDWCRALAAAIDGRDYVGEWDFAGCGIYDGGARCGREVVERLVPIYGDHNGLFFVVPVCELHLRERLEAHLLAPAVVA